MSLHWRTLVFRGWAPTLDGLQGLVLLRGRVGRALKAIACVAEPPCGYGEGSKEPCRLPASCPYAALFEGIADGSSRGHDSTPPTIFRLDVLPTRGGVDVVLEAAVVGWPRRLYPHLVLAVLEATRRRSALLGGNPPFETEEWSGRAESEATLEPSLPSGGRVRLDFLTPLRLLDRGRPLRRFDAAVFLRRLVERLDRLDRLYGGDDGPPSPGARFEALLPLADRIRVESDRTTWREHERYSAAQDQPQRLDGLTGRVILSGVDPALGLSLALGQRLLAGRSTSMGCGRYRIKEE